MFDGVSGGYRRVFLNDRRRPVDEYRTAQAHMLCAGRRTATTELSECF
jgi:hypothetical protein